jgi:hypothetical protein
MRLRKPLLAVRDKFKRKDKFEELVVAFASSIVEYSYRTYPLVGDAAMSGVSKFLCMLEWEVDPRVTDHLYDAGTRRKELRWEALRLMGLLERKWTTVAEHYTTLKLFCERDVRLFSVFRLF